MLLFSNSKYRQSFTHEDKQAEGSRSSGVDGIVLVVRTGRLVVT